MDNKIFLSAAQYGDSLVPRMSQRRVQALCKAGRIPGAFKLGTSASSAWIIPAGTPDSRMLRGKPRSTPEQ